MKTFATIVAIVALAPSMAPAAGAAGDYQSFLLMMDRVPDGTFSAPWLLPGGFSNGKASLEGTLLRSGKFPGWYPHLNIREGGLTLDGKTIKGQFTSYDPLYRIGTWALEGAVDAGRASGAYSVKFLTPKTGQEVSYSGKFTGTITSGGELAKSNAIAAGKDWPCWTGPYTSMAAVPSGQKLVDSLDDARLVWRSQQSMGLCQGNFSHPYFVQLFAQPFSSGSSSPIIAEGKVFLSQRIPDKEYDPEGLKTLEEAVAKDGLKAPTPGMKLHVSKTCHDWYACIDAATGQTLWGADFPDETAEYYSHGKNAPDHKNGPIGQTPCYAQGKLFGLGLSGYLRAMDAKTGKQLWKQKIEDNTEAARRNCHTVVFIGGVVMVGNSGDGLHAFEPETGKELWKGVCGSSVDPQRWTHGVKEYAIVMAGDGPVATAYRCLDPKTGKERWKISGKSRNDNFFGICGDTLALVEIDGDVPAKGKDPAFCICAYTLTPDGARKRWQVPAVESVDIRFGTLVTEKHVVVVGWSKMRLLDIDGGKQVAGADLGHGNYGHTQVVDDRFLVQGDGVHGSIGQTMVGAETFKVMGKPWSPPMIPHTTSYRGKPHTNPIVDGRIYFRGADGIYCYDLRKTPGIPKVGSVPQDAKAK